MRKSVKVGVASAGLLLIASPAAAQSDTMTSLGNIGLINGNQIKVDPLQIPINACGNAVGLLGFAAASCQDAHATANFHSGTDRGNNHHGYQGDHDGFVFFGGRHNGDGGTTMTSILNPGLVNGNQVDLMIQIPVNLCGNAIGILGGAFATCSDSSATANAFTGDAGHRPMPRALDRKSQMRDRLAPKADRPAKKSKKKAPEIGLLGGLLSPVTHLLGAGGADAKDADLQRGDWFGRHDSTCDASDVMTSLANIGVANGNQVDADIQVPVNVSGNAIALLGGAVASARDTSATANYC